MKKIDIKKVIISFSVVIILVLLSMIFTKNTMGFYDKIIKPDIAPKGVVFPVVWTILYFIIAVTLYRFFDEHHIRNSVILNLVVNVMWPILFFRFNLFFISIIWLALIIVTLIYELVKIYRVDKRFAYLNLPYLFWLFYALYLNIMIFSLN